MSFFNVFSFFSGMKSLVVKIIWTYQHIVIDDGIRVLKEGCTISCCFHLQVWKYSTRAGYQISVHPDIHVYIHIDFFETLNCITYIWKVHAMRRNKTVSLMHSSFTKHRLVECFEFDVGWNISRANSREVFYLCREAVLPPSATASIHPSSVSSRFCSISRPLIWQVLTILPWTSNQMYIFSFKHSLSKLS